MVLKEHDLLQIDSDYIRQLKDSDPDALAALSLKLVDDLKEAWERMNQNSGNSSRPPGSEAPWAFSATDSDPDSTEDAAASPNSPADEVDHASDANPEPADAEVPDSEGTNPPDDKRSPGRQPGSPGFGRTQQLAVTDTVPHHGESCFGCGHVFDVTGQTAYTGFYSIDLQFGEPDSPGLWLTNTLHHYYQQTCSHCGLLNQTEPLHHPPEPVCWDKVELSEWRLIGPGLAAFIAYLCMDMRLTRRKVEVLLYDLLGLRLCVGSIQNSLLESARALSPVEDKIVHDVLSDTLLHADETSHKEAGALLWLWVFVTTTAALFLVGKRSKEIWLNLVDSFEAGFQGWLMTDGYQVYRDYQRRLRCWAHLIRKAKGLAESYDRQVRSDGKQLQHYLETLMAAVYQAREGPDKGTGSIAAHHQETIEKIRALCEAMATSAHKKTRELGGEFLNDWEAIFRILNYPAWPLTNNEAERALRHWVILRKITQGTRSEQGSRALALFASVITTCRLRKASPLWFMRDVIQARRKGMDIPTLPEVACGSGQGD